MYNLEFQQIFTFFQVKNIICKTKLGNFCLDNFFDILRFFYKMNGGIFQRYFKWVVDKSKCSQNLKYDFSVYYQLNFAFCHTHNNIDEINKKSQIILANKILVLPEYIDGSLSIISSRCANNNLRNTVPLFIMNLTNTVPLCNICILDSDLIW